MGVPEIENSHSMASNTMGNLKDFGRKNIFGFQKQKPRDYYIAYLPDSDTTKQISRENLINGIQSGEYLSQAMVCELSAMVRTTNNQNPHFFVQSRIPSWVNAS